MLWCGFATFGKDSTPDEEPWSAWSDGSLQNSQFAESWLRESAEIMSFQLFFSYFETDSVSYVHLHMSSVSSIIRVRYTKSFSGAG